jgi:hypothetical protein
MAKIVKRESPRAQFRPFVLRVQFDDPEDAEHFLLGMIVARSNNSNETIVEIIDGINAGLEKYRSAKVLADVEARDA